MTRKLLLLLVFVLSLSACDQKKASGNGNPMPTDSAYYHQERDNVSSTITAHLPAERMNQPVGEWLDEMLGGVYSGDQTDIQGLADFYGQRMLDTLAADSKEMGEARPLEFEARMEKTYETELFVTYELNTYTDLGGAHPSSASRGATFRKKDGRRLDWAIVSSAHGTEMDGLIKKALMDYFEVDNEKDLSDQLFGASPYVIPRPQTPPYFTEDGVAFVYQQYEIAAYAAGMPNGIIAYDQAKPLLTSWARRLLK